MTLAPYNSIPTFAKGTPCPAELIRAVRLLDQGCPDIAEKCLSVFVFSSRSAFRESSLSQLALIFSHALLDSIAAKEGAEANSYPQLPQIELFNLLSRHAPWIYASWQRANTVIADRLLKHPEAALLDIGIGNGRQTLALLEDLSARGIRRLAMVAVEPSVAALWEAERLITWRARKLGIGLEFQGIARRIEDFDASDWYSLGNYRGRLIVNAAFALHRVGIANMKDTILQRLRELHPHLLVLIEPHVDHHEPNLIVRLLEAWHHFSLVFRYLDVLDDLTFEHKAALKTQFLGREIRDILQLDDALRSVRHERAEQWVPRLLGANFEIIVPPLDVVFAEKSAVTENSFYLGLGHRRKTLVALILAAPNRERLADAS